MSRISDVSSKLGQYMLSGWVLTDDACTVCSIPLLRTPAGQSPERLFCVQCEAFPGTPSVIAPAKEAIHPGLPAPSIASTSSTGFSRVSTPPTEVSSTLSSPTFAPPPDPQETLRRRAQSDLASAEIARRMLRGWAMLAEECPNDSCYGVPLLRPPKPGGGKDPRKECVVCGHVYVFEKDLHGLDMLVPADSSVTTALLPVDTPSRPGQSSTLDVRTAIPQAADRNTENSEPIPSSKMPESTSRQTHSVHSVLSDLSALDAAVASLDRALSVLSQRLITLLQREPLDHVSIGDLASSMEKVTNALWTAKQIRCKENSVP